MTVSTKYMSSADSEQRWQLFCTYNHNCPITNQSIEVFPQTHATYHQWPEGCEGSERQSGSHLMALGQAAQTHTQTHGCQLKANSIYLIWMGKNNKMKMWIWKTNQQIKSKWTKQCSEPWQCSKSGAWHMNYEMKGTGQLDKTLVHKYFTHIRMHTHANIYTLYSASWKMTVPTHMVDEKDTATTGRCHRFDNPGSSVFQELSCDQGNHHNSHQYHNLVSNPHSIFSIIP